jgi:hypothetical protein
MVIGINRFRDHFAGCEHQYVLIGGAACELIMDEAGLNFRATKDLDIVLIVEALNIAFAERFWSFIEQGQYQIRERADGNKTLYRFSKPSVEGFPAMLELFSRAPEGLHLAGDAQLTPLPIDEAAASLSAILLDTDYYEFLKAMVREIDGIPILDEAAIIPFKARAWVDLSRRREGGEQVDEKAVRKHRNDIARLLQILGADARYELSAAVHEDMSAFVSALAVQDDFDPLRFDVAMTREAVIERLRDAYGL